MKFKKKQRREQPSLLRTLWDEYMHAVTGTAVLVLGKAIISPGRTNCFKVD